jgi:hypothetical protein
MFLCRTAVAATTYTIAVWLVAASLSAKEARPPKWTRDALDAFFSDAREKLQGERPNYSQKATALDSDKASASPRASAGASTMEASSVLPWSQIITAETIETEIKRLSQSLGKSIGTPSKFKGGGYKDVRRDFSELAVLFAVVAEYDAPIRWKDTAAGMRELFARAAANAKVGTYETFREASLRKDDLAELVRGSRPQVPKASAAVPDWSKVSAREPLMQRLSIAQQERLQPWLADSATFRRNQADAAHEAQLVALIANVIHRAEYEYWDDETFADVARELQAAASDVSAAAQSDNFEQARRAFTRAATACANCHDGYRG